MMDPNKKLTGKEELFCQEYLTDLNAAGSARRAGYKQKNVSDMASKMMKKPHIKRRIDELKKERVDRLKLDQDAVLMEVMYMARAKITDVVNIVEKDIEVMRKNKETGKKELVIESIMDMEVKDTSKLPDHVKAAISKISRTKFGLSIEMHSKDGALDKLMKHFSLYAPDKIEHSGGIEIAGSNIEIVQGNQSSDENEPDTDTA